MAIAPDTPVEDVPTPDEIKILFEPFKLGRYDLSTRVVYAPLTRCRAINTVPVEFTAQYYAGTSTGLTAVSLRSSCGLDFSAL